MMDAMQHWGARHSTYQMRYAMMLWLACWILLLLSRAAITLSTSCLPLTGARCACNDGQVAVPQFITIETKRLLREAHESTLQIDHKTEPPFCNACEPPMDQKCCCRSFCHPLPPPPPPSAAARHVLTCMHAYMCSSRGRAGLQAKQAQSPE